MFIIGPLEDQIPLLLWHFMFKSPILLYPQYAQLFEGLQFPFANSQPVTSIFLSFFLSHFGTNSLTYLIVLTFIVNFVVTYLFFKQYKFPFFYTSVFVFSSYTWVHLGTHLILSQIWVIPTFFMFYKKFKDNPSYKSGVFLGLLLTLIIFISNYLGLFLLITFLLLCVFDMRLQSIKVILVSLLTTVLLVVSTLSPYIKANYLTDSPPDAQRLVSTATFEDFFTFSSRPWYFIVPPVKNPILGGVSTKFLDLLRGQGNFLTDDYFKAEHQANYFGLVFLTFFGFVVFKYKNKKELWGLFAVAAVLVLLMMPPYFTVFGLKIYTPGYLMAQFLPVLRVTARISVILHFILLLILAKCLSENPRLPKIRLLLSVVVIITLVETYIPIKFYNEQPPQAYAYLSRYEEGTKEFLVYPYNRTNQALLWAPLHKQLLINPRGYKTVNFDSKEYTEGLVFTKELKADFLLMFPDESSSEVLNLVANDTHLKLAYQDSESILYEVVK